MQKTANCTQSYVPKKRKIPIPSLARLSAQMMLVMKITIVLLTLAFLNVHGTGHSQTISYSGKNLSMEKVLLEVKKQTGYEIMVSKQVLRKLSAVNVQANNMPLNIFLAEILKTNALKYTIVHKTIFISPHEHVERGRTNALTAGDEKLVEMFREITGTVSDENGNPLEGASVKLKGAGKGTFTDAKGVFRLEVPAGNVAVLEISFVGFETIETRVPASGAMNLVLKYAAASSEEIVVVGYGTQKKTTLTGSVANISGKELRETPAANITNLLGGRLPGVIARNNNGRPGSGSALAIRGFNTLGDNSPLIVVDNVQRSDFSSFDPNEIESITVLKDAAASAVYGARANNGVILITTRRGKAGKPTITYTGSIGNQQPTQYPSLMSPYDYANVRNQAQINRGYSPSNPSQAGLFFKDSLLNLFQQGKTGTDWYDATFKKNPLLVNHNISLTGGNDALRYFLSVGTVDQEGMYDNISYKAHKFRSNIDASISKSMKLGIDLEGRQEKFNAPGFDANSIFGLVIRQNPTLEDYWPSGRAFNTAGEHPVEMVRNSGYNRSTVNTFQGTLSLTQQLQAITPGLSASARASFGKQYTLSKLFFLPYVMYNEDGSGNVTATKTVGGQTYLNEGFSQYNSTFYNISLNYQRNFGKHDVSGLLLYERNENMGDQFSGSKSDFPIDSKDELYVSGSRNQSITGTSFINDSRKAVVGRVGYVYDGKYLFEASFRNDGSYIFPKGKRFGLFPSVSAGWRISEEEFFKNSPGLSFVSNLKIRASKGLIGNDKVAAFQYQDSYNLIANSGPFFNNTAAPRVAYGVFPNPDITWEKSDNTNIGLEATFWKGLLGVEFDYFVKKTKDILFARDRSIPATFGRTLPSENYAKVDNKGFEVMLTHQNRIGQITYNARLIGSYAMNKVTAIDDPAGALDFQKQLGKPLGFVAGYESLGFFQNSTEAAAWMGGKQFGITSLPGDIKYNDLNKDGAIDSKDQVVLSKNNSTPRIMYGFSGGVRWNNFDANFLLQGAASVNLLLSGTGRVMYQNGGSSNNFAYLADSWSPTNTTAKYPLAWVDSRSVNDQNSAVWLKNAAYARLKSIDLGYTLSNITLKDVKISQLRFFVAGSNLFTISKLKEFDPEAEVGSGSYYPQQKIWSMGLNLTF